MKCQEIHGRNRRLFKNDGRKRHENNPRRRRILHLPHRGHRCRKRIPHGRMARSSHEPQRSHRQKAPPLVCRNQLLEHRARIAQRHNSLLHCQRWIQRYSKQCDQFLYRHGIQSPSRRTGTHMGRLRRRIPHLGCASVRHLQIDMDHCHRKPARSQSHSRKEN